MNWARDELSARVQGHVTVLPRLKWTTLARCFSNPNAEALQWFMERGESSTYPHVSCIETRCRIEIALRKCLRQARSDVANSKGPLRPKSAPLPRLRVGASEDSNSSNHNSSNSGANTAPSTPARERGLASYLLNGESGFQ
jgi:hypothetical protein